MKLKLFTATIECWNTCYTETFVVVAKDSGRAHKLLLAKRMKDHSSDYLKYIKDIVEIPVAVDEKETEKIIDVWFGHAEDKNSGYHDD